VLDVVLDDLRVFLAGLPSCCVSSRLSALAVSSSLVSSSDREGDSEARSLVDMLPSPTRVDEVAGDGSEVSVCLSSQPICLVGSCMPRRRPRREWPVGDEGTENEPDGLRDSEIEERASEPVTEEVGVGDDDGDDDEEEEEEEEPA